VSIQKKILLNGKVPGFMERPYRIWYTQHQHLWACAAKCQHLFDKFTNKFKIKRIIGQGTVFQKRGMIAMNLIFPHPQIIPNIPARLSPRILHKPLLSPLEQPPMKMF